MAAPSPLRTEFLGYGAITKFFRRELFQAAVAKLTEGGYRVHVVDCSNEEAFRDRMTTVLRFEENFGYAPWTGNLDALNDAFRYVDYESVAGVVFAFEHFDRLHREDAYRAHAVLDILECASRDALLAGWDLVGLLQSDDPRLEIAPCGARTPTWNQAEWLNTNRGI
jgi:hypothetical protein